MGPEVFYFTGTGISLVVAQDIAEKIGGSTIAIKSTENSVTVEPQSDMI